MDNFKFNTIEEALEDLRLEKSFSAPMTRIGKTRATSSAPQNTRPPKTLILWRYMARGSSVCR